MIVVHFGVILAYWFVSLKGWYVAIYKELDTMRYILISKKQYIFFTFIYINNLVYSPHT